MNQFIFPLTTPESSGGFTYLLICNVVRLFILNYFGDYEVKSQCGFILCFKGIEHIVMCLFVIIHTSSFVMYV